MYVHPYLSVIIIASIWHEEIMYNDECRLVEGGLPFAHGARAET